MTKSFSKFLECYQTLVTGGESFIVATVVECFGSNPQDVGAKAIISGDGLVFGTVGGGKVENFSLGLAHSIINNRSPSILKTINLTRDLGMNCGGEMKIFFETHHQADIWNVVVFGAGHVSQELCRILLRLNLRITCVDNRKEWLDKLPEDQSLEKVHLIDLKEYVKIINTNSYVLLMTMGSSTDLPILKELLNSGPYPYLGVIGSGSKRASLEKDLKASGYSDKQVKLFFCPMGERISTNHPGEIALSISAQILKLKNQLRNESFEN